MSELWVQPSIQVTQSIESCVAACSPFMYAGAEYGREVSHLIYLSHFAGKTKIAIVLVCRLIWQRLNLNSGFGLLNDLFRQSV